MQLMHTFNSILPILGLATIKNESTLSVHHTAILATVQSELAVARNVLSQSQNRLQDLEEWGFLKFLWSSAIEKEATICCDTSTHIAELIMEENYLLSLLGSSAPSVETPLLAWIVTGFCILIICSLFVHLF